MPVVAEAESFGDQLVDLVLSQSVLVKKVTVCSRFRPVVLVTQSARRNSSHARIVFHSRRFSEGSPREC